MGNPRARGTATSWSEGRDGRDPIYREWLTPPVLIIGLGLSLAGIVGIAYAAAYGSAWGWVIGSTLAVLVASLLLATTVTLRVDDRVVRAGRARLPLLTVTGVATLDREAMIAARRHGDPRDYLVLRAWSSRVGVAITLEDPRDPHPCWIVTTRHPDRFAQAINEARSRFAATSGDE
jgi:hypothetical protein